MSLPKPRIAKSGSLVIGMMFPHIVSSTVWAQTPAPPQQAGTPGIFCTGARWCVGVDATGNFWTGDPRSGINKRRNILEDKLGPRSWSIFCSLDDYCTAIDSFGNWYAGDTRHDTSDKFRRKWP